jgi:hypothetical protein
MRLNARLSPSGGRTRTRQRPSRVGSWRGAPYILQRRDPTPVAELVLGLAEGKTQGRLAPLKRRDDAVATGD